MNKSIIRRKLETIHWLFTNNLPDNTGGQAYVITFDGEDRGAQDAESSTPPGIVLRAAEPNYNESPSGQIPNADNIEIAAVHYDYLDCVDLTHLARSMVDGANINPTGQNNDGEAYLPVQCGGAEILSMPQKLEDDNFGGLIRVRV